jgi:hypothetical protein
MSHQKRTGKIARRLAMQVRHVETKSRAVIFRKPLA